MPRQRYLSEFESDDSDRLDVLTDAEKEVYENVREGDYGAREYARETDRSPGTVSNLLARADLKLPGENAEARPAPGGN